VHRGDPESAASSQGYRASCVTARNDDDVLVVLRVPAVGRLGVDPVHPNSETT